MARKKKTPSQTCAICQHVSEDSWSHRKFKIIDEKLICELCSVCPECDTLFKKNIRIGWCGSLRSCVKCHEEYLRGVLRPRKTTVSRKKTGSFVPMVRMSTNNFKIKHYIRLEKEYAETAVGNAVRVIEVGLFYIPNGHDGNIYHKVSQYGCSFNRIDTTSWNRNALKIWHPSTERITTLPELGGSYGSDVCMIERYVKKMRPRGWRLVARFDMHGKKHFISSEERLSTADAKRQDEIEVLDDSLGRRHENRIEKIDDKYEDRKYGQNWLTESTSRGS